MNIEFSIRLIFTFLVVLFCSTASAQVDKLKRQKAQSEKELAKLNKLLSETRNNKSVSLSKLKIIQLQMDETRELLNALKTEIDYYDVQITNNERQITDLMDERNKMLELYSNLIYNMWKNDRNPLDYLMFILSSSDYNQAYKRFKYSEQIRNYSKKQMEHIQNLNDSLDLSNKRLYALMYEKNTILNEMSNKQSLLADQQNSEQEIISQIKQKESDIVKKIAAQTKQRQKLDKEINKMIANMAKKSGGNSKTMKLTPKEQLLSSDFSKNKGKLPWPVVQGVVTEKFGLNVHPVHKRVQIMNNGINIATTKNASVQAVFDGVVSQIALYPGQNNVVLIKHGDYFTLYINLIDVTVKTGQVVKTKDVIGKVDFDQENGSVLSFQLWKGFEKLNPELWLSKLK